MSDNTTNGGKTKLDPSAPPGSAAFASEFNKLVLQWERDTVMHSSLSVIFSHPAHQQIIAMGKQALPLILLDLQQNSRPWFDALASIIGRDVAEGVDSFTVAKAAWLRWGKENKYIS